MLLDILTEFSTTVPAQTNLRPLGSFEELLWQMDKRSPLHFTLAAHVDGSTTIQGWRKALEQTRQRHPLWSAFISKTADGAPFFGRMHDAAVRLRVVESDSSEGWEQEVAHELSVRFDSVNGPLVRAVLMHAELSSMLILSAHHSIGDGMSLAFAIRDLLQALSGSKLSTLALHSSEEDSFGLHAQPRAQIQNADRGPESSPVSSVYRTARTTEPEVQSLQLSIASTEALRTRARKESTTVHAALVAAAGIAARRNASYGPGRDLQICSTISNRGLLRSPEDCCVLFTACGFPIAEAPVRDFWTLARRSKDALHACQNEDGVKAVLGAVDGVVKAAHDDYAAGEAGGKLFQFDIHLSNLGAKPIPTSYGVLSLRQLWGPGVLVGFKGEQTLGINTLNGSLCLLHTSHVPLPNFLKDMESLLRSASDQ